MISATKSTNLDASMVRSPGPGSLRYAKEFRLRLIAFSRRQAQPSPRNEAQAEVIIKDGSARSRGSRSIPRQHGSSRTKPPSNRKTHSRSRSGKRSKNGHSVCCSWCETSGAGHSARARNPIFGELASILARRRQMRRKSQLRARPPQPKKPLRLSSRNNRDKTSVRVASPGQGHCVPEPIRTSLLN